MQFVIRNKRSRMMSYDQANPVFEIGRFDRAWPTKLAEETFANAIKANDPSFPRRREPSDYAQGHGKNNIGGFEQVENP
jgi:hypothetical protein